MPRSGYPEMSLFNYGQVGCTERNHRFCRKEGRPVRKLAVPLGVLLAVGGTFGARALASSVDATVDSGPPACATVNGSVDGTPVAGSQQVCVPPSNTPGVPSVPDPPSPPSLQIGRA